MPVRIYDIAKKFGITSKEVLTKAKELGITTGKVPSSTLDKITAEFLEQHLVSRIPPPRPPVEVPPAPVEITPSPPPVEPAVSSPEKAPEVKPEPVPSKPTVAMETAAAELPVPPATVSMAAPAVSEPVPAPEVKPPEPVIAPQSVEPTSAPPIPAPVEPTPLPAAEPKPESKIMPAAGVLLITESKTEAPAPPAPPPPPRVGDKVGFIQLPPKPTPKPAPKMGEKAGSTRFPQTRPVGRPEQRGRPEHRDFRGAPGTRPAPVAGTPRGVPSRSGAVARPEPSAGRFVMPEGGVLITMKPPIVVRQLAEVLKRKPFQLIADLMELGVFANVNQSIDETVAQRLCAKHGFRFEVEKREKGAGQVHAPVKKVEVDLDDKPEDLKPRPPVVTIMGHVDHGKTTLLDCIRKSNVAAGEAGGITQHIGAYTISIPHPERPQELKQITFLDTPGHAAFSAMRARGANVTDIVILVVAADDGVMPQTVEAIHHAQAAKVTIMVAVNKCDSPRANAMQVRQQMQEHGLVCEEWGGNTIFQDVSALTKMGVDKLLELLVLQADMLELKANPGRRAKGNVVESGLEPGGPTATVLVRKGTLRVGDIVLCGQYFGKARALINEEGNRLKEAGPSVAVKLLGISGVPEAGLEFSVVESEKSAREMAEQRAQEVRAVEGENRPKVTLENLFQTLSSDAVKNMRVVVKGDTQGSVEAIVEALKKIESHKVQLEIIHSAVGTITESDALLASASKAIILGFHTRVDSSSAEAARREGVQIKLYSIIYELIDEVKDAMAGLLEPISKEVVIGMVEVKQVFALSKGSKVAGCAVQSGRMVRGRCRVVRRKDTIFQGTIGSLRRFQDEVSEVRAGMECGIRVDGFEDFQPGDIIESFTIEKVAQKL